ncbi:unnamed protein product [[Candida] boidinii]|nr:unnamed protein product [[Candida] boidinii]
MDYSHQNYTLFNGNNSNSGVQNYMMPNMAYNDNNQNQHYQHQQKQQQQHQSQHQNHHSNGFLQQDFQNHNSSHHHHHHHQQQSFNYSSPPSSVGALSMTQRKYNQQQQSHHSPHSDRSSPPSHPVQFEGVDRSRLHHSVPLGLSVSANSALSMPPSVPMMSSHSQTNASTTQTPKSTTG